MNITHFFPFAIFVWKQFKNNNQRDMTYDWQSPAHKSQFHKIKPIGPGILNNIAIELILIQNIQNFK